MSAKAFSMMEIIIGMVIIAVLAVTLVTSVGRMRQKARDAQCLSNLRQLSMACLTFVVEHNGKLPFGYTASPTELWDGVTERFWYTAIAPYVRATVTEAMMGELDRPGILACPADKVPWVGGPPHLFRPSCSYAWPIGLAPARLRADLPNPLRLAQLRDKPKTVMLIDSVFGNVFNPAQIATRSTAANDPNEPMMELYLRHQGANAAFLDGHCEYLPGKIPQQAPTDNPFLWGPVIWGTNANL